MNAKIKALSEQARQLTPEERIELIEDLQQSLAAISLIAFHTALSIHA
jgi:hypothetical protein